MRQSIIYAEREVWGNSISIRIGEDTNIGRFVAKPPVMEKVEEGEFCEPTLRLDMRAAQKLMDELWHCGLRPSEGTGSAGQLAATERHLADMRSLVFKMQVAK